MTQHDEQDRRDRLWEGLRDRVAGERGVRAWLRSRPTRARIAAALAATALVGLAVLLLAPRTDFDALPAAVYGLGLAATLGALLTVVVAFLHPLQRRPPGRGRIVLAACVALALPALLVLGAPLHDAVDAHPESFDGQGADLVPCALRCFAFGLLLGAVVLVLLRLLDRRDALSWPRLLLLAGATGLVGNLALALHCPLVAPAHLLAGHATVPLGALLALAPAALGRRQGPEDRTT